MFFRDGVTFKIWEASNSFVKTEFKVKIAMIAILMQTNRNKMSYTCTR